MKNLLNKAWEWFKSTSFRTKLGIFAGLVFVIMYLRNLIRGRNYTPPITKEFPFGSIVQPRQVMRNDTLGLGHYGASRDGGIRSHAGIDIEVYKSQPIYAPFNGTVTRKYFAYPNNKKYLGLEMISEVGEFKIKIMYCVPTDAKIGSYVKKGEMIGYAQAISEKYSTLMTDHLHVELYQYGNRMDPSTHIQLVKG
jgi:hypothetical protein